MVIFIKAHFTDFITLATVLSNILFVVVIVLMLVNLPFRRKVYDFVYDHASFIIFGVSLVAMLSSLTYSEIIGYVPCELCWLQRIVMYPQVLISFIALKYKDKGAIIYLFWLSILGLFISFYHSLIHWGFNSSILKCSEVGAPCAKVYVLHYGYISIPFMSFTMFAYIFTIAFIYYKAKNVRQ